MLRHKFFHRAKKVPVSEQELKAKMKKKGKKEDKKEEEKSDEKKKKEDDAGESSHAEGKEVQQVKFLLLMSVDKGTLNQLVNIAHSHNAG